MRLHGEDRRRPRRRRRHRHHRVAHREPALGGQGQGRERPRPHRRHPRPRPPPRPHRRGPRSTGARIRLISDGDVYGAIATASPDAGADVLFGIGGTPEGVIAAAALKCMGGEIQGRLWPRNDAERGRPSSAGYDLGRSSPPTTSSRATTASSPPPASPTASCCRASTSTPAAPRTQSLVMRSRSGTVRLINARHRLDKLQELRRRRLRLTLPADRARARRVAARAPSGQVDAPRVRCLAQASPQARGRRPRRPRSRGPGIRRPMPPASAGGSRTPGPSLLGQPQGGEQRLCRHAAVTWMSPFWVGNWFIESSSTEARYSISCAWSQATAWPRRASHSRYETGSGFA